jgi:YfiH family protein
VLTQDLGAEPFWLTQIHGTRVFNIDDHYPSPYPWSEATRHGAEVTMPDTPAPPEADASLTSRAGLACAILVADCLPVLVAREDGGLVGGAHAGWRGLAGGVLPNLLEGMRMHDPEAARQGVHIWLGPCIGPTRFEVGPEVQAAFAHSPAFYGVDVRRYFQPGQGDRLLADLSGLARAQCLAWAGHVTVPVRQIQQDPRCTATDATRFYSFRRDGRTGRMAAMIWRKLDDSAREPI